MTRYNIDTLVNLDIFIKYELVWKLPYGNGYYQGAQAYENDRNHQTCFTDPNNILYGTFSVDKATSQYWITAYYTKTTD